METETVQNEKKETEASEEKKKKKKEEEEMEVSSSSSKGMKCLRVVFAILLFPIFAFFIFSLLIGIVTIFGSYSSIPAQASVPTQCKIVSSSVDIRSSKVCELGLLNYKAKHVFYSLDRNRFRCRYDYYWASVFEVEYLDPALGQTRFALAEAPNEALPLSCRPNFGAAWLTKAKFKVNESYDCWYTSGISEVSLYREGFFSCQAKDPSSLEMTRRYFFLIPKILQSWFVRNGGSGFLTRETVAGVLSGFGTSLITITLIPVLHLIKSWFLRTYVAKKIVAVMDTIILRRVCFLVAYFSIVSWLTIQYWKRLGLSDIYRAYNH